MTHISRPISTGASRPGAAWREGCRPPSKDPARMSFMEVGGIVAPQEGGLSFRGSYTEARRPPWQVGQGKQQHDLHLVA